MDHVTAFPTVHLLSAGVSISTPMKNFVFTNNLVTSGIYPVWSVGGGTASCAFHDVPLTTITACFAPNQFAGNVTAADLKNYPASKWPAGNSLEASFANVGFTNYANG